jgi:hypothetical protein
MTAEERALYDEALPGVEGEIRAAVKSRGTLIDPHAIRSRALMVASDAAMGFEPRMCSNGTTAKDLIVRRVRRSIHAANMPERDWRRGSSHADGSGETVHAPGESDGPEAIDLDELFLQADLNERDREFLFLRFGLSGEPAMTFEQVAKRLRVGIATAVRWQAELFERIRERFRLED